MVETLYKAIKSRSIHLQELTRIFGGDDLYVKNELHAIRGMQDAFAVIAGHSYTDHLLAEVDELLQAV